MKSVCIPSYSGPYFPTFELNTDQNNSEDGHFLRIVPVSRGLATKCKKTSGILNIRERIVTYIKKVPFFCEFMI